jgi:hypothetical protein
MISWHHRVQDKLVKRAPCLTSSATAVSPGKCSPHHRESPRLRSLLYVSHRRCSRHFFLIAGRSLDLVAVEARRRSLTGTPTSWSLQSPSTAVIYPMCKPVSRHHPSIMSYATASLVTCSSMPSLAVLDCRHSRYWTRRPTQSCGAEA